ncbi:cobalamin biosynthesis protein CbiM [Micromonospora terminaliae]|uniref:Cobalamin biosynthesis protein CbiM n=1 Tax=Micromonospora terminaliae TaxID=1914461 RepID=A0AAJ2ZKV1_9ACTN|nr:PDGLE domain-containing protein [Micromonospora terminaliae]NES30908.1 cobalamin biosynthesis protein CbiM [Micromonospora terminaliae]QGL45608.1 cobalamin biosynthesis protein CbiM [Micromonospora terminaliae]
MSKRSWPFVLGGLLVALLLAGVVSNYASAHPDGLDSSLLKGCTVNAGGEITGGSCPAQQAKDHELADSPLADYGVRGVRNGFLSTGLSGVLGVLLTFAIGGGLFWLARRRGPAAAAGTGAASGAGTGAAAGAGTSQADAGAEPATDEQPARAAGTR